MKQGNFKTVCLVLMVCVAAVSAFGDENTVDLESRILDSFDGDSGYTWQTAGSRFATKNVPEGEAPFPRLAYINAWPVAVFGYNPDNRDDLKSLGIWGRFDRRGYNWVDFYPAREGDQENGGEGDSGPAPAEIPIPGRVRQIDIWVWGSNLHYRLEAYVRDHQGIVHVLDFGSINHSGWKNLRVQVPASLPQARRTLPLYTGLTFVKFRLWTPPVEPVDNFYVYFDQLKVLTDMFETHYDGDELGNPERVQELWSSGSGTDAQ